MSIISCGYEYLKIGSHQFELEKFVHTLSKAKLYKCKKPPQLFLVYLEVCFKSVIGQVQEAGI